MIVGSLLLILVAVALLVLGLAGGSSVLLISSIAASLLAAVALVAGARQAAAARSTAAADGTRAGDGTGARWQPADPAAAAGWRHDPLIPTQQSYTDAGRASPGGPGPFDGRRPSDGSGPYDGLEPETVEPRTSVTEDRDGDPVDEPAAQPVSPADEVLLARLPDEVFVVDGRPRYHLAGCPYLSGRATEPLPVGEATELGFTPCAGCEAAAALLADSRRV